MDSKRENFVRIAESRTNKIIKMLKLLSNCSNKSSYNYSKEDVRKIFTTIEREVKLAKAKFEETDNNNFSLRNN